MNSFLVPLALTLPALPLTSPVAEDPPPLFRDLDFAEAKATAQTEGKFLVLDAMTSWCGPCKIMDKTTWIDPLVESWVAEHAVAVQLDMDVHESVKNELNITAFPTMVVFKSDGTEFDRYVGLMQPAPMLRWLEGARSGKREIDTLREDVAAELAADIPDNRARILLASRSANAGAEIEAARLVLRLWDADIASEKDVVSRWRLGAGRHLTRDLARANDAFRAEIESRRDERRRVLDAGEDRTLRREWIALNGSLDDADETVLWAALLVNSAEGRTLLQDHESELFNLLISRGMWTAAGHALADPISSVRFLGDNLGAYDVAPQSAPGQKTDGEGPKVIPAIPMGGGMQPAKKTKPEEQEKQKRTPAIPMIPMGGPKPAKAPKTPEEIAEDVRARLTHELRGMAARRYGALLAADRGALADAVARLALEYADDDATRAALVAASVRSGEFDARRESHLAWLSDVSGGAGE